MPGSPEPWFSSAALAAAASGKASSQRWTISIMTMLVVIYRQFSTVYLHFWGNNCHLFQLPTEGIQMVRQNVNRSYGIYSLEIHQTTLSPQNLCSLRMVSSETPSQKSQIL